MWCASVPPASARRPETRWRFHLSRCPGFGVHLFEPAVALLKRRRNARELILGVWLQGGLYAARHLTDGHLPRTVVESLPGDIVRVLIEVGLWLETDKGIQIHDYLVYNPSSVTVLHKREKAKNRVESHRQRKRVTPLHERYTQQSDGTVTPLHERYSRARGTPPHPTPSVPNTHIPSSTSAEQTAWGWWHDLWAERWPHGILQMPQTKAVELERLEQQLGLEELTHRMARYLDDEDPWLLQHKHPVGGFIARVNSYEAQQPVRPISRIRNCPNPKCRAEERGHDDTCDHCDWTREAWEKISEASE